MREKKRNKVDENGRDFKICYNSFNHPLRDNVRIPLSNITSSISNIGIQNRRSPLSVTAKSSSKPLQTGLKESLSYNLSGTHAYENIVYQPTPQPNTTGSHFSPGSSISNITAVSLTPAQRSAMARYSDIGDPAIECTRCGALMWYGEKTDKRKHSSVPKFQQCCGNGKIQLPLLKLPPPYLNQLLFQDNGADNQNYQQYCRLYNMMFAFTSPGMKFDNRFNAGGGPPNIRVHGQPCHRIGSMMPLNGQTPRFSQLYIYDTENEVQPRIKGMGNNPNIIPHVVTELKNMLDEFNTHAKSFRMAADRLRHSDVPELKLRLVADRSKDGRIYNQPNVAEVAALIVGDVDTGDKRDIILERQSGKLKRISEFHPAYLALQYPLLFPYGEDGFRLGVLHRETSSKKKR
ncbi:uncharacterized protein LOC131658256 [Vicia villosa]|uniref:uncharacterized protein LOC131658256 n=1 Tax=Vicia villosa TaxID=3911 RepID=UPI00273C4FE2|nr:uncharacterized protein LOC131658256 [Vicia villosa]